MKRAFYIFDGNSNAERKLGKEDFPLTVGGDEKSDVRLPACTATDGSVYIDLKDDNLSIRPSEEGGGYLNGQIISEPHPLKNGDTIRIATSQVRCDIHRKRVTFHIDPITEKVKRRPPARIIRSKQEDDPIAPVAFTPAKTDGTQSAETEKSRLVPVILVSLFGILLLLAAFVLTATSVTVHIEPVADHLEMDEGPFAFRLGDRFLVWPGSYSIKAEKAGFHPLDEAVDIVRGEAPKFSYSLRKQDGFLTISSVPVEGADVVIDGNTVGKTPVSKLQLSPGMHQVSIRSERYQEAAKTIEIDGAATRQQVNFELVPNWAAVTLDSEPSGATVRIDGQIAGTTLATLDVLAGRHQLVIETPGYEPWQGEIDVVANQPQKVPPVKLNKAAGFLALKTEPTSVSVTVGGTYRGQTPLKLKLTPDTEHKISLFKAGYQPLARTITVAATEEKALTFNLRTDYGRVVLAGMPTDAELFVDGRLKEKPHGEIKLTAVAHQIEVRKKGFVPFKTTLTPRSGFPQRLQVKMAPKTELAVAPAIKITGSDQNLLYLAPGRFTMGASRREQGRRANEVLHEVVLSRAFYISAREITNAELRKFKPDHDSGTVQSRSLDGDRHPVVRVSWDDAVRYCNWLSKKDSLPPVYEEKGGQMVARQPIPAGYRLPTEAEWAWAARFAKQAKPLKYPWGEGFPPPTNSGNFGLQDDYSATAPVASFKANPVGLYDMAGNVSEWMHDYYSVFSSPTSTAAQDPVGPVRGEHHVIRGSSWRHGSISELRLSYRDYGSKARSDLGFRVARYAK